MARASSMSRYNACCFHRLGDIIYAGEVHLNRAGRVILLSQLIDEVCRMPAKNGKGKLAKGVVLRLGCTRSKKNYPSASKADQGSDDIPTIGPMLFDRP
jgi:hypothetical protein